MHGGPLASAAIRKAGEDAAGWGFLHGALALVASLGSVTTGIGGVTRQAPAGIALMAVVGLLALVEIRGAYRCTTCTARGRAASDPALAWLMAGPASCAALFLGAALLARAGLPAPEPTGPALLVGFGTFFPMCAGAKAWLVAHDVDLRRFNPEIGRWPHLLMVAGALLILCWLLSFARI